MISKNGGTDYRPKGDPRRVNVHDFEDKELGKVVPYGVYDVTANAGWGSVRITCDTAQFAVASSITISSSSTNSAICRSASLAASCCST